MTTRQRVLLLGATGETGGSILEGLLAADQYEVEILVRLSSASKQSVKDLVDRGVQLRVFDLSAPQSEITSALSGIDILISAIGPRDLLQQKSLVRAAKAAGVKRFIPCAFITIAPPTGAMLLRDEKEEIYNEIKRVELPYTVIDVGFWHQISFPSVPSGRVDYAKFGPDATIHGDGDAPNILTDLRDIGRFVARIIADDRTLNQFVYTCGDVLTENQIFGIVEELSGEKIERTFETSQQIEQKVEDAVSDLAQNPDDLTKRMAVWIAQYSHSKYVRKDNRPEYAKYLGYRDARELYPDLVPVSFRDYFLEVLDGKGKRPYMG